METKKVVLVGDARVGKTTLVNYLLTGKHATNPYNPTLGVDVSPIVWGGTRFNVWDTAGNSRFGGLREGYYVQAQIAVVMYDNDEMESQEDWVTLVRSVCPNIPVVECVNHFGSVVPYALSNATFHLNLANGEGVESLKEYLRAL